MSELHFFDSHAHILGEEFNEDRMEMLDKCANKHVDRIMIITLSNDECRQAIEYARKDPQRFQVACGIFPLDVEKVTDEYWNEFVELVKQDEVLAIGEIGLDYYWEKDEEKRELQKEFFIKQIELAKSINKPILVHSRDAIQDTYNIMKEHKTKGLLHCFPGSIEMANEFTKLGYYIALGGPCTFKNARHAKEVVKDIDLNYLLTETDSPYMAPEPVRGTRNDPSNIPYIAQKMADIREMPLEEMAQILNDNYTRFLEGK